MRAVCACGRVELSLQRRTFFFPAFVPVNFCLVANDNGETVEHRVKALRAHSFVLALVRLSECRSCSLC